MTETTAKQWVGDSLNVVAIDFGSTSSAAAMFRQRAGVDWPMDPNQARVVRKGIVDLLAGWPGSPERLGAHCREVRRTMGQLRSRDWNAARYLQQTDLSLQVEQIRQILVDEDPLAFAEDQPLSRERQTTVCLDVTWSGLAWLLVTDSADAAVRTWGALRLHDLARSAFTAPAFAFEGLYPVAIDREQSERKTDIPSVLLIEGGTLDSAHLTSAPIVQDDDHLYLRDIKRGLIKRGPLPPGISSSADTGLDDQEGSDLLIGQVHKNLKERVELFNRAEFTERQPVDQAVITYPTTTPPSERARLETIVRNQAGISDPLMRYDEAVASVLFTLMRDFGGNMESGIETFRATSRPRGVRSWRKNLLIIDIGGGTTDIAFAALNLSDQTEPGEAWRAAGGTQPRTEGRIYQLEPEILGATGHPQMGGDLLTLRVFYWIKAALADAVRTQAAQDNELDLVRQWPIVATGGELPALAAAVVDFKDPRPAPKQVATFLRELIPTRNAPQDGEGDEANDHASLTDAFEELWRLAEEAKITLAESKAWTLAGGKLDHFAELLQDAPCAGYLSGIGIELKPDDFKTLARPVLGQSVDLAVDLMWHLLQVSEDERLDGVTLTGRAAGVPLVRELLIESLAEAFGKHDPDHDLTPWNPAVIRVENHYPKAAASIGACWAQVQHQYNQKGSGIYRSRQHKAGGDQLRIGVDNLILNMPCRFSLVAARERNALFNLGHPLDRVRWNGDRYAASNWEPCTPDIVLVRYIDGERFFEWGRYNYRLQAGHELPHNMSFQIEIDQNLTPSLLFCRDDKPRHVLDGTPVRLEPPMLDRACFDDDGSLRSLPDGLWVADGYEADGKPSWRQVFEPRQEITERWFPDRLIDDHDDEIPARIAARPLPAIEVETDRPGDLASELDYTFSVRSAEDRASGGPTVMVSVPAPGQDAQSAQPSRRQGWVVLDAQGKLYVLPGHPRYQPAGSLDDAEEHPGSVYRTRMGPPYPYWESEYDPFTGEH